MHCIRKIACNVRKTLMRGSAASVAASTAVSGGESGKGSIGATMRAWQIEKYGGTRELRCNEAVLVPPIVGKSSVLVEIRAASVNPLDTVRTEGYGGKVIGAMRLVDRVDTTEFPLTLGRDFSGIVRGTSRDVTEFKPGDEVMGIIQPHLQGTHAEYVVASEHCVVKKPKNMSHVEATSFPYAGLTAWSSLCFFGGVKEKTSKGRRALILGASGGVGTIAIQLLKTWGMNVTTVVREDAIPLVIELGADCAIDYTQAQWEESLRQLEKFDFILNCTTNLSTTFAMDCLKVWESACYVHTTSPLLRNIDAHGWPLGVFNSATEFGFDAFMGICKGQWYRWSYILPSKRALEALALLITKEKIRPVIDDVFTFEELPLAYEKVRGGHARGKTVINYSDEEFDLVKQRTKSRRWGKLF